MNAFEVGSYIIVTTYLITSYVKNRFQNSHSQIVYNAHCMVMARPDVDVLIMMESIFDPLYIMW